MLAFAEKLAQDALAGWGIPELNRPRRREAAIGRLSGPRPKSAGAPEAFMRDIVRSFDAEFRRYRKIGEDAIAQFRDDELCAMVAGSSNSVATLVWHLAGNLKSRFTDFITADGEKPWRDRESEFARRDVSREELIAKWSGAWGVLSETLDALDDEQLSRTVRIRGQELSAHHALCRSLAHVSYHVGQLVLLGRQLRGADWQFLSIPPGGTAEYDQNPTRERGP